MPLNGVKDFQVLKGIPFASQPSFTSVYVRHPPPNQTNSSGV